MELFDSPFDHTDFSARAHQCLPRSLRAPLLWWLKMISAPGNRNSQALITAKNGSPAICSPYEISTHDNTHSIVDNMGSAIGTVGPISPQPPLGSAAAPPPVSIRRHRRIGSGASSNDGGDSISFQRATEGSVYSNDSDYMEGVRSSVFGRTMAAKRMSDTGSSSSAMSR